MTKWAVFDDNSYDINIYEAKSEAVKDYQEAINIVMDSEEEHAAYLLQVVGMTENK